MRDKAAFMAKSCPTCLERLWWEEPERTPRAGPRPRSEAGEKPLQEHRVDCIRGSTQEVPQSRHDDAYNIGLF
ncbi:hypothetical protein C0J52_08032 [Blattella germanica]|nr:hypothetical protein C0J52_08032 [Blattella germanica]